MEEDEEIRNRDKKFDNFYYDENDDEYYYYSDASETEEFYEVQDENFNEETYLEIYYALKEYVEHVNSPLCEYLTFNDIEKFFKNKLD